MGSRGEQTMAEELDNLGRPLPPPQADGFRVPSLTCDAGVIRMNPDSQDPEVLLITRKNEPFKGCLAFPGGFVDYGEDPVAGCVRELLEETHLKSVGEPVLVGVYGKPARDPRKHIVSILYALDISNPSELKAGDDAASAQFYSVAAFRGHPEKLAFDHYQMLTDLCKVKNIPFM